MGLLPASRVSRRLLGLVVGLAALFLALVAWMLGSTTGEDGARRGSRPHAPVIAMLPLEAPAAPELAWLSSGLPDALRLILVRQPTLRIVDRQVVAGQQKRLQNPPLERLARELRADALLTGTLRDGPGGTWDLSLRLLRFPGAREAWSCRERLIPGEAWARLETLARGLVQGAGALGTWVATPPASLPRSVPAWRACTEGLDVQVEEDLATLQRSLERFQQAVSQAPDYAPAQAHLAYTLQETAQDANIQGHPEFMAPYFRAAREAGERAAILDPGLGLAQKALAALAMGEGRQEEAEHHARTAVDLDPSDYHSLVILGDAFAWRGDARSVQASQNFYRSALAFAPSYWWAHFRLAVADQLSGELEEAVAHADAGILLHPGTEFLYVTAADALYWLDRPQDALDRVRAGLAHRPDSPILQLLLAYGAYEIGDHATLATAGAKVQGIFAPAHAVHRWVKALRLLDAGDRRSFLAVLDGFRKESEALVSSGAPTMEARIASVNLYFMGRTLAKLGERDRAIAFLDLAERLHPGKLGVSRKDPAFLALPRS